MDIKRAGSQPSGKGPADWFTGSVRDAPTSARKLLSLLGELSLRFPHHERLRGKIVPWRSLAFE